MMAGYLLTVTFSPDTMGCSNNKILFDLPPPVQIETVSLSTSEGNVASPARRVDSMKKIMNSSSVLVVVRVRPLNDKEKGSLPCISVDSKVQLTISDAGKNTRKFNFDSTLDSTATQVQLYETTAKLILQKVLEGYNGTVFAYGQTGAGKTFSMQGNPDNPGVVPLMMTCIFNHINGSSKSKKWTVRMTYIEIYQEILRDLLVETEGTNDKVNIREGKEGTVFLEGALEKVISSCEETNILLKNGQKRRETGATNMNAESSRSHGIVSLIIEQQDINDDDGYTKKTSKLHLIDLAGSERAKATGATGERLKEGAMINQSLSALGNVINALGDKDRGHVPYRDSKLTRLLQDSLGGNSYTLMICNVSPATLNYDETISSLRFAERAKKVVNDVKVNQNPGNKKIIELMEENKKLKDLIQLHIDREKKLENIIEKAATQKRCI